THCVIKMFFFWSFTCSCITASVLASASVTHHLLSRQALQRRPFRVTNADRSVKKGIMADSLEDLMNKAGESLHVPHVSVLVLDEDGTDVETEEFFQTLPDNSVLMVLDEEQKWTPHLNSPPRGHVCDHSLLQRTDVAKVTFDLYKNNPKDFIGCLNIKATLYGVYSVSYDMRCYAAKSMLREALRWTLFSMQATGHILLGSSCYIEQLLEEEEEEQSADKSLALPQKSKIKQLQTMLMGKMSL
uniref:Cell death inducing DFFA like effector c n=1 Tax=Cynoglossus semilaevis TaxID=244447 RepID=A0A3P8V1G6_CYNSE